MSLRIKKGDTVQVITGKDKGKTGKVMQVFPAESTATVEGVNIVKKHKRARGKDDQGGIVELSSPMSLSNLAIYCEACKKGVRFGAKVNADKTKSRVCKKCGAQL
jgi:large subunit ribosomal protein L24